MSFAVWQQRPPFGEAEYDKDGKWTGAGLNPSELIYFQAADGSWQRLDPKASKVPEGVRFVVTDQGPPTQAQVDAVMTTAAPAASLQDQVDALTSALQTKNVITSADLEAASATVTTATAAPATKV